MRTPTVPLEDEATGGTIWVKLEYLQPSGSTKDRLAVFEGIEPLFRVCFAVAGGGETGLARLVSTVLISGIAIHHYFIDGALYKLRNPQVRRDLFAHLTPPPAKLDQR